MKKILFYFVMIVLFVLVVLTGCGRKMDVYDQEGTQSNENIEQFIVDEEKDFEELSKVTLGVLKDNYYFNHYFGFSISLPEGWINVDYKTQIKVLGEKSKLSTLFIFFQHPFGEPYNNNILCNVEKVQNNDAIYYLENVKTDLDEQSEKADFEKKLYKEMIGNQEFSVLEINLREGSTKIKCKTYSIIIKGYALNFVATTYNDEVSAQIEKVMQSVEIETPSES